MTLKYDKVKIKKYIIKRNTKLFNFLVKILLSTPNTWHMCQTWHVTDFFQLSENYVIIIVNSSTNELK